MNRLAIMLLVSFAVSAAHAAEGDRQEFLGTAETEEEACDLAKAQMDSWGGYEPEGNGDCDSCEEQHTIDGADWVLTGETTCKIVGIEQEEEVNSLMFDSN